MSFLSIRNRADSKNIYAVTSRWNPKLKKQVKDQVFVGTFKNGHCTFNERAQEFASLISQSEFGKYYWQWREFNEAQSSEDSLVSIEAIRFCEDKNAGICLLLDKISSQLGLTDKIKEIFGERLGSQILSLAYYCARGSRMPLYRFQQWGRDQVLPWPDAFTTNTIAQVLDSIESSDILSFLGNWTKRFSDEEAISLDITSVSSYSTSISDVMKGYNRDKENLPQINMLMIVSQKSKLPLWFEQLPGAISDPTTMIDTLKMLQNFGHNPQHVVIDRGFASDNNIKCLLRHKIKFTMGIPLNLFTTLREEVAQAYANNEFCNPDNAGQMYDEYGRYFTQYVTRLKRIDGHRIYMHMYYTDFYKVDANERLMQTVVEVEDKLKRGLQLTTAKEIEVAQSCFKVKNTPKRGLQVKPIPEAIAKLRDNDCGYFVLYSTACKDAAEALRLYKLRDGVEKRFDDLKNEEDLHRLRVHSAHNMKSRLFIQFIAQILRCQILKTMQDNYQKLPKSETVTDILYEVESLRRITIENHRPFYKRPTKKQREIFEVFGVSTNGPMWPSLR